MIKIRFVIACLVLVLSSCKSSYEKIRTSGDPAIILKSANSHYAKKDYVRAQALYEMIITSYRGQKEAEEIYFNYANSHFYLSEYDMASHLFKTFSTTFINSPKREDAEFMAVYSIYKTSPEYQLDQSGTEKAIEGFQIFVNTYPESPRVAECNKLIDEMRGKMELKAFEQGKLYYELKNYQASVTTLENLLTDYPDTKNTREVRYLIIKAYFELAQRSIFEKQKERYLEAVSRSDEFLKRFPNGKFVQIIKDIRKQALQKSKNSDYDRYKDAGARN
ncbi:MAG: outer membrane protein assembly factor BamD [Bacteroidota bacterium]|nr:outer membrane protein assembly factor BamD [Bacteroidota bacterium]